MRHKISKYPNLYFYLRFIYWFLRGRTSSRLVKRKLRQIEYYPKTFSEKIQYKMAYDRNPLLTIYADKCQVRQFVADRIGNQYLSETYGIISNPELAPSLDLPSNFVLKTNHGSGASIIVWDGVNNSNHIRIENGDNWQKYLINPIDFDWDQVIPIMKKWLKQNYWWVIHRGPKFLQEWLKQNYWWDLGRKTEWAYKYIQPKILFEELLLDENHEIPKDYKFFMFEGVCEFIQVDSQRFKHHMRDFFDLEWNLLDFQIEFPKSNLAISKPKHFDEMLNAAQQLAKDIDFIRVDLYECANGVKFGELTNYPGAGSETVTPKEWDNLLGKGWKPTYIPNILRIN